MERVSRAASWRLAARDMTALVLRVKVKPRANVSGLSQAADGTWIARLKSAPVDGKANEELVALIAEHFRCRASAVTQPLLLLHPG
jgi:uncharacterized protein